MPENSTALDMMRSMALAAPKIAEAAAGYLELMESEPRPRIVVGGFYHTFDGSFVYVAKRHTACKCAACTGRQSTMNFGPFSIVAQMMGAQGDDHEDAGAGPERYVILLLRGGHGIKDLPGEEPGERFTVDAAGWTNFGELDATTAGMASRQWLGVCGLSLRRKVEVHILESTL